MNKLEMAHDWFMKHGRESCYTTTDIASAWKYADAMQAESDKREEVEREQKRKEIRELLNADNTFLEKEGQHFDDVEWQPDWSQAPEWANWWAAVCQQGKITGGWFFTKEPVIGDCSQTSAYFDGGDTILVNSFGYTGNWQDSLRKRPE